MTEKLLARFRYARHEDASHLADLYARTWRHAYRGIIPFRQLESMIKGRCVTWWQNAIRRGARFILVCVDEKIIGYASIGTARIALMKNLKDPTGEIMELYLDPDYQATGFGRRLFSAAWGELKKHGNTCLVVWALRENTRACEFYESLGGTPFESTTERFGGRMLEKLGYRWSPDKLF